MTEAKTETIEVTMLEFPDFKIVLRWELYRGIPSMPTHYIVDRDKEKK